MVVHGLNMVYKVAPYYPAASGFDGDDAAFLGELGFNVVRVGVIWKALEPGPGVYNDRYLRHVADTVRTLAAHGIFSLLEFHQDMYSELFQGEGAPDWAVQGDGLANPKNGFAANDVTNPALQRAEDNFWANSPGPGGVGLQNRFAAAWRHVAEMFRDIPGVLGYELWNEPTAGAQFATCLGPYGCPAFDAQVTAFDRRVASAIRKVDSQTLIFYEPDIGFDFGVATHVHALRHRQAGFAFHVYCMGGWPDGCPSQPQVIANALDHVANTHEALLMTEWGSSQYPGDLTAMMNLADRYMVPWIEWAYCSCSDPTGATGDPLVLNPAVPPVGANVGQLALHILVEPYPQLIAGTPRSWGYNGQTKRFQLRYSTARADRSGWFGSGTITQIATPRLIYRRPYAVHVHGGTIVSPRGASVLEIAACPGAREVSVQVLPGGRRRESCRRPKATG